MKSLPTLRRELITAYALVFAGALLFAASGILLMLPRFDTPTQATAYVLLLVVADVVVFAGFGRFLVQRRLLAPIDQMIEGAEAIAHGDYERRLPTGETVEIQRLGDALNHMAERLIADQELLAANIKSLDETNQLLTEARDAMVRSEKLASAGRLAAGIAHEIGNPLGAIVGYLGLIGRQATSDKQKELVASAEREAHRIDRIVRGLLDFSRPHEAKALPLDVNAVVRETVDLVSTQGRFSDVDLRVGLEEVPLVVCDSYQLQQVLVNLFVNAADAMGERPNKVVSVRTISREARGKPQVQARRKDDPPSVNYSHRRRLWAAPAQGDPAPVGEPVVEILVTDNGPGIPREMLGTIFEPFVTTKEPGKGTGLGLAVCARLIEGMGGVIRAQNDEATGGAQFSIVLPPAEVAQHSLV